MHFDVTIIGGGPAGIALGIMLVEENYNVCVVDKAVFPRDKLCGGLLTKKTVSLLSNILKIPNVLSGVQHQSIDHIHVIANGWDTFYRKRKNPYAIVNRVDFDSFLVDYYKSLGGIIWEGTKIEEIRTEARFITLSNKTVISYDFLVGADGVYSSVREHVDANYKANGMCFENYIDKDSLTLDKDSIYLFYGLKRYGYGWVFPRIDDYVVGVGGVTGNNKDLTQFKKISELLNISDTARGRHLAFGEIVKQPLIDNIILVGDAAGLVDPITGEGLYYALLSAKYAFLHITQASIHINYLKNIKKIHKKILLYRIFRPLFYNAFFQKMWFGIIWKRISRIRTSRCL